MVLTDVSDWLIDELVNEPNNDRANRILNYLSLAEKEPKPFQVTLFGGLLSKDRDAYAYAVKANPDWRPDLQKAIYGRKWDWGQDQVAQLLGFKEPVEMFRRDPETGNPAWMLLVGEDSNPGKVLDKYYAEEENLEPGKLYNWLTAAQAQYDNQAKYTGGGVNALRSLFAPRVQEDLFKTGDFTAKDVLGDFGENVVQLAPWNRAFAAGGKALTGTRALGKLYKPIHGTEYVFSNAAAPLFGETYDALVYGDLENPNRSRFDLGDVLGGTATNVTTAPIVAGGVSSATRLAGVDGINKRGVREFLSSDPYVTAQHKLAEYSAGKPAETGKSAAQLRLEGDLYRKVFGASRGDIKKLGEKQALDWEKYISDYADPKVVVNLEKDLESILAIPDEKVRKQALADFYANRRYVTPTTILGEEAKNYGLTNDGRLAFVGSKSGLQPSHNVPVTVDPSQSAQKLARNERMKHTDPHYPRKTKFDEAVLALENDPAVVAVGTSRNPVKSMATGYVTNKLGKQEYGKKLTGEDVNLTEIDEEVASYLNDEPTIRMWKGGFKPRGREDEPIMKAYRIFEESEKKRKEREARDAALSSPQENSASSTMGKKAGF